MQPQMIGNNKELFDALVPPPCKGRPLAQVFHEDYVMQSQKIDPLRLVKAVVEIDGMKCVKSPGESLSAMWSARSLDIITDQEYLKHLNKVRSLYGLPSLTKVG